MITVIQPDVTVGIDRFQQWLEEAGHEVIIVQTEHEPVPTAAECGDGLVILGGRMNIFDTQRHPHLDGIRGLIREAVTAELPVLGICLGHQLLADALGGNVVVGSDQEEDGPITVTLNTHGENDPLFAGVVAACGTTFKAAASHHDCVTVAPEGATVLASSQACGIQALRYGSAVSVQFHPEVFKETVAQWHADDGGDYDAMLETVGPHYDSIAEAGKQIADSFAHIADTAGKGEVHG